jgi:large subunit ribosomal protein L24
MLFQAHAHLRYKHFSAPLSPEMRASHKASSLPVRTGDTVRVMRGDNKGFEGKITRVDRGKYRVYVEGLTREKVDGTAIFVPVHPSKVMITNLNLDDKWRKKIVQRRKEAQVKLAARTAEEPKKKAEKVKPEIVEGKIPTEEKPEPRKPRETKKRAVRKPARKKTETETPEVEEKPVKKRATRRKTKKSEAEGES